jgi:hypothetical protein
MNAERLLKFSRDFIEEYQELKIPQILDEMQQLCNTRPQTTTNNFTEATKSLSIRAHRILGGTRFSAYPEGYLRAISGTPYADLLPANAAKIVISGLTGDVSTTIPTNEFIALANRFREAYNDLLGLERVLSKLGVAPIVLGENQISIEFSLPRSSFNNVASQYLKWNEIVNAIIAAFGEYVGENEGQPELVFTASTDPTVGFIAYIHAAYAVTQLVGGLLDVAKKAINFYSSIKTFREIGSPEAVSQLETDTQKVTRNEIEKVVRDVLNSSQKAVEDSRANELSNAIVMRSILLLPVIIEGASISISPESFEQLSKTMAQATEDGKPTPLEILSANRIKYREVEEAARISGIESFTLLAKPEAEDEP